MFPCISLDFEYLFDLKNPDGIFVPTEEFELVILIEQAANFHRLLLIDKDNTILYVEHDSKNHKGRIKSNSELTPEFLNQFSG
ncbi:hypothetical protein NG891_18125 [Enterococcus gallinarum]|uniref:hypothetical protein n=1 Tax=Enterococcus gallinarum TaxID=1353 RepID=UPI002091E470|nr:hypothetical protein [Enterococcus gallinarum]MCO5478635.1 hypothetical protein [Enterococcus gallinarum]